MTAWVWMRVRVGSTPLDTDALREDHLHRLDVLPVPDGAEAHVGKAQHEQVHHKLLAEVMVDVEGVLPAHLP